MNWGFYILFGAFILVYGGFAVDFILWQRRIRKLRNEMYRKQEEPDVRA